MTCECCKKLRTQLRRARNRRYYRKHREQILNGKASPEKRTKQRDYNRAFYLRNKRAVIDKALASRAEKKRRQLAKRERDRQRGRQRWKTKGPQINADRRARQVSKWRKYREGEKNDNRIIMPSWQSAAALLARLQEHHT